VTGGNPFLVGELLWEAEARGLDPTAAAADVAAIVPRRLANAVLLRLAPAAVAALARAFIALGDGAQVGDAARLAGLVGADLEAMYGDLSAAERVRRSRRGPLCSPVPRRASCSRRARCGVARVRPAGGCDRRSGDRARRCAVLRWPCLRKSGKRCGALRSGPRPGGRHARSSRLSCWGWAMLALAALTASDDLEAPLRGSDEILSRARECPRGADGRDDLGAESQHRPAPRRFASRPVGCDNGDRAGPASAGCRVRRPAGVGGGAGGP